MPVFMFKCGFGKYLPSDLPSTGVSHQPVLLDAWGQDGVISWLGTWPLGHSLDTQCCAL